MTAAHLEIRVAGKMEKWMDNEWDKSMDLLSEMLTVAKMEDKLAFSRVEHWGKNEAEYIK